jgi:hypothetical protein
MSKINDYLLRRIARDDYRGQHLAQHNRLPEDKLVALLTGIYNAVGDRTFTIPPGDDPQPSRKHDADSERIPKGFDDYFSILDEISKSPVTGVSATFNSLKKNHFPNFEGMGLIHRKVLRESATASGTVFEATLTPFAIEIINAGATLRRAELIGTAMKSLIGGGFIDDMYSLLKKVEQLNVYEVMLIASDTNISLPEKEDLIRDYRRLKRLGILKLHVEMEKLCATTMALPKKDKRDWHNWWNEARQIMTMMSMVNGFNVYNEEHLMLAGSAGVALFSAARSEAVKAEALRWHGLDKIEGWELHHIYPVEYATCERDMTIIDSKENLLYIPAALHRKIPTRSNLAVGLAYENGQVFLTNPTTPTNEINFVFEIPAEIQVNASLLPTMIDYNKGLLAAVA